MIIPCSSCQHEIHLEDSRVPEGVFKIKCPKCGKLVTAQKGVVTSAPPPSVASNQNLDEISPAVQAYVKQEIAAARSEMMGLFQAFFRGDSRIPDAFGSADPKLSEVDKKALICHRDSATVDAISSTVKSMGYRVVESATMSAEAVKKLELTTYHLVIVHQALADDKEGGRKLIGRINGLKPIYRRQCFLVLLSPHVKSADSNHAFFHGVNFAVFEGDMANLETLIREGQRYYQQLYYTFNRVLEKSEEHIG